MMVGGWLSPGLLSVMTDLSTWLCLQSTKAAGHACEESSSLCHWEWATLSGGTPHER